MKKILIVAILFVAVVFAVTRFLQHTEIWPQNYPKSKDIYVSRVVDGDTIELSNGEQVRYIGIDTPELWEKVGSQWVYKPRPYAEEAKNFNQKLVEGKRVRLEFDVQKRDKYNRLLAYVFPIRKSSFSNNETFSNGASVGDTMVNLEMVRQGYAMLYTYPPNVKYAEKFLDAQRQARENNRGLWGNLEGNIISASQAKENIGLIKMVTAEVLDTYLSEKVLILNCKDNFKVAIFRDDLDAFPKLTLRSPDTYFKHKIIRVFGVIKEYKGACEIVVNNPSQLEVKID